MSKHHVRRAARSAQAGRCIGPEHAGHVHPRPVEGEIAAPRVRGRCACLRDSLGEVSTLVQRVRRPECGLVEVHLGRRDALAVNPKSDVPEGIPLLRTPELVEVDDNFAPTGGQRDRRRCPLRSRDHRSDVERERWAHVDRVNPNDQVVPSRPVYAPRINGADPRGRRGDIQGHFHGSDALDFDL